jgi:hypothetical protein
VRQLHNVDETDVALFALHIAHCTNWRPTHWQLLLRLANEFTESHAQSARQRVSNLKGKTPIVNVIDTAAKWLHENNLGK